MVNLDSEQLFASKEEEDQVDFSWLDKFVIDRGAVWKKYFDFFMIVVTTQNIFQNGYYAAFGLPQSSTEITVDIMTEMAFLLDIFFCFCQEYLDEESYLVVTDFRSISKHYLSHGFLQDFIAFFPIDYLIISEKSQGLGSINKLRLLRGLKCLRIPRLFNILNVEKLREALNSYYGEALKKAVDEND